MPLTGHCLCKAVTYTVDVDAPILTGYDHCDDCQRQSGSTYCTFFQSRFRVATPHQYPKLGLSSYPAPAYVHTTSQFWRHSLIIANHRCS